MDGNSLAVGKFSLGQTEFEVTVGGTCNNHLDKSVQSSGVGAGPKTDLAVTGV